MYPSTWIDAALERLRSQPGRIACVDETGEASASSLVGASGRLVRELIGAGLRRGDRVVVGLRSDRRFVTLLLAAHRLGLLVVPLHPKAKLRELNHVIWDAGPRAAFADEPLADLLRTTAPATRWLDLDRLLAVSDEPTGLELGHDFAGVTAAAEDPALLLYTSGTTGKPKGALHTQGSLAANVSALVEAWRLSPEDRLLHCLPLQHLHGLVVGVMAGLVGGVTLDLVAAFDEAAVLRRLAESGATLFFGVPAMYARMIAVEGAAALPRMRLFVSGSAPLPPALKRAFEQRFGHVILERYGATEMGIALSQELDGARPAGAVGRPLATVEGRLVRLDDGGDDTHEGELWIRGPSLFSGYHEDPEATAKVMSDGWYRTGDLARCHADGSYSLLGRLSTDMLKVNGHRVGALEIEACLADHPLVAEVAVIGTPDTECGEVPIAFVRLRSPEPTGAAPPSAVQITADLLAHATAALAPQQVPRRITLVDDFLRVGPGKIDKQALRSR